MSLTVCFLTRDKEQALQNSLDALKGFADEIIIVDTGSKEKAEKIKNLAQQHKAKHISFAWKDDFSAARNAAIAHATKDWILFLKPGETIAEKDKQKIKEKIKNKDVKGYLVFRREYTNNKHLLNFQANQGEYSHEAGYAGYVASPQLLLFRRLPHVIYEGSVFEDITPSILKKNGLIKLTDMITHYVDLSPKTPAQIVEKQKYYLSLCLKEIKREEEKKKDKKNAAPKYYYESGKLYKSMQHLGKAEEYFKKSIALDESYRNPHAELADIFALHGKQMEAIESYEKSLAFKPDKLTAHLHLGMLYAQRGRYKDAIQSYQKALALNQRSPIAYQNLASALLKTRNFQGALKILDIAFSQTKLGKFATIKKDIEAKLEKSKAITQAIRAKDFAKAESLLKEESEKNPDNLVALTNLGAFYAVKGDHEKIIALLSPVVDKNKGNASPKMLNLYNNLASAYVALNKKKDAVKIIKQALKLQPDNAFFEKKLEEME